MLAAENLHVTLREPVLRGVSLSVPENCFYGLIGAPACGKSVLVKALVGLLPATRGRTLIGGKDITAASEIERATIRRDVGMLFQNYALFDHMTVGENIAFPLRRLFSMSEDAIRARVANRLERVALPGIEERSPSSLSGGQKKRVGIARATAANPPFVIYDEPTAGLDPVTSQQIYDLIRAEQLAKKASVIAISSDVSGLLSVCDRVAMLHNGTLVFDGTVEEARSATHPAVDQFVHGRLEGPL